MAKSCGVKPPLFAGKAEEDADGFVKSFERYCTFREVTEDKKLNLFAVLLKDSAADWLDALDEDSTSTYAKLRAAFTKRYSSPVTLKYKSANELLTKKQADDETVDVYVTQMRKFARLIEADENILMYAVINGLKPQISAKVTEAQPQSVEQILEVARLAELTMSRVATTSMDSAISQQLLDMQAEMRRLSTKVDRATTSTIAPTRSPTPERRVHFATTPSTEPSTSRQTSSPRNFQGGRYNGNTSRPAVDRRQFTYNQSRQNSDQYERQQQQQCTRCAKNHSRTAFCPARDPRKVCHYCGKRGHFQAGCFSFLKQH